MDRSAIIYGTAWKEEATRELVVRALAAGFRAIDTANQRKHYHEAAVGEAIHGFPREELFLQTKFTHRAGQDHRLPYDARAHVGEQVRQSFARSLEHLGTSYVDAYVLHGPSVRRGLAREDVEAWEAMEDLHRSGGARALGISNVTREQIETLLARCAVRPSFVQNRCYASARWDGDVRALCRAEGIVYQGFSLLTANREELPKLRPIAARLHLTPEQVVFRFALDVGMRPLTGTTSHMEEDLAVLDAAPLSAEDVRAVEDVYLPLRTKPTIA